MSILLEKLYKADINTATSGDNTIIAAPTEDGQYIAIDMINFIPSGAMSVTLKDGATAYGGTYALAANQAFVLDNVMAHDHGIITLTAKTAFVLNLGSATQVSGFVRYRLVGGK